ncbi:TPA_exp: putative Low molecular weight phosphotyrosine protein phosphatase [Trichophyton benhamiae CBS 112371]|nr:TPA_exp: putative Low molecular weight phosphotyrosine protein phosphatase [Trichophyton benhamiae CBS 112371]
MTDVSVLFVCLGNICRSPMAEAVFRHIASSRDGKTVTFSKLDSAGTCAAHLHDPPDPRTMSTLKKHGITDFTHAARRVRTSDFTEFDYLIAMDQENYDSLMYSRSRVKEEGKLAEVRMFGDFDADRLAGGGGRGESEEVPDPYYGGRDGFDRVYDMVTRLSNGFIDYLEKKHAVDAAN